MSAAPVPINPYASEVAAATGQPTKTRHERATKTTTDADVRCWKCSRLLIELAGRPWRVKCSRCKATNQSPPDTAPPA